MKILLIDDDSFLRDMYSTKFTEAGYEVMVATDAVGAMEFLSENTFDVVLLDMVMPTISGLDFLKKVTKEEYAKDTKFIVLSNQSEESDKQQATDAGASGYIVKAELVPSDVVKKVTSFVNTQK